MFTGVAVWWQRSGGVAARLRLGAAAAWRHGVGVARRWRAAAVWRGPASWHGGRDAVRRRCGGIIGTAGATSSAMAAASRSGSASAGGGVVFDRVDVGGGVGNEAADL
uniref:Uncharacterized protein n=1 Tax=Oryza sativa subsp. japonica TaxID=39947 RepID=Q5Z6Q9_ORYSJ|nr:hypothetical protein [Oryza sativa Japonica Group]